MDIDEGPVVPCSTEMESDSTGAFTVLDVNAESSVVVDRNSWFGAHTGNTTIRGS
jgi:hypothetical protein